MIPVVPSVALLAGLSGWGDALIAEGHEAGGHIGETTTLALVPQVVDAVDIPVIAAGGIADARGVAARLPWGLRDPDRNQVHLRSGVRCSRELQRSRCQGR